MNGNKNRHVYWVKGIAIGILCLFLVKTLAIAGNGIFLSKGNAYKLAPRLLLSDGENRGRLQASLICKLIEERASYGKSIEDIYLDDILLWTSSSEEAFEGCRFEALQHEIQIYLPAGNISIRYYNPTKADTIIPFSDITKLNTCPINSHLNRQIIYTTKALPAYQAGPFGITESAGTLPPFPARPVQITESLAADMKSLALDVAHVYKDVREAFSGTIKAVRKEKDRTPVSVADYLIQIKVRLMLNRLFPEDGFIGEEDIDIEELRGMLSPVHHLDVIKKYEKEIETYEKMIEKKEVAGRSLCYWILDPLDGTLNYLNGLDEFAFSLARVVWDDDKKLYVHDYGIVYAPQYEMNYEGKPLRGPLVEYRSLEDKDREKVTLWETRPDGQLVEVSPYIIFYKEDDEGPWKVIMRDSKRLFPKINPHREKFAAIYGEENVIGDWESSVVGMLEVLLGNYAAYNSSMSIWDHAAIVPMILTAGGEVFREDNGQPLRGYTPQDIEAGQKKEKFAVTATRGGIHAVQGVPPGRIKNQLYIDEISLREYLESENYFYPILPPEVQESVVRRIMDLQDVIVETNDGKWMSIEDFARYVLSEFGYEDRLEHIMVFGSYIFSNRPDDIDFFIGLRGSTKEDPAFDYTLKRINTSNRLKKGAYRFIFPEGSEKPVENIQLAFIGQGIGNESSREEYLAKIHLLSGVFIYGDRIYKNQIRSPLFEEVAAGTVDSLYNRAFEEREMEGLDSKKAMHRILHAVLILGKINRDSGLKTAKPEKIYELMDRYLSEEDPLTRAEQAVLELQEYLRPEKANSIFAYFLAKQTEPLADVEGEEFEVLQMNAINHLVHLAAQGNLQAYQSLSKFNKDVKSERVRYYLVKHAQVQLIKMMQFFDKGVGEQTPPEVIEIIESFMGGGSMTHQERGYHKFTEDNTGLISALLADSRNDVLLRVPIEAIETAGIENVKGFLNAFQAAPNGYVELYYMSGTGEVSGSVYQRYNLDKKPFPKGFARTRHNTITLFPVLKGEEISLATVRTRLGDMNLEPTDTIMSPVGLQHDPTGLIRGTVFGLRMMHIARQRSETGKVDEVFVKETVAQYRELSKAQGIEKFDLTEQDMIDIATGNINQLIRGLRKLIELLPITPMEAEELRRIYEHAKQVLMAA